MIQPTNRKHEIRNFTVFHCQTIKASEISPIRMSSRRAVASLKLTAKYNSFNPVFFLISSNWFLGPDMQDYHRHSVTHLKVHISHCIQNLQQWKSSSLRRLEFYWLQNCKSVSRYVFHMLTLCKRYCREIRNSKCEALYIMSKLSSKSWSLSWSLSSS